MVLYIWIEFFLMKDSINFDIFAKLILQLLAKDIHD